MDILAAEKRSCLLLLTYNHMTGKDLVRKAPKRMAVRAHLRRCMLRRKISTGLTQSSAQFVEGDQLGRKSKTLLFCTLSQISVGSFSADGRFISTHGCKSGYVPRPQASPDRAMTKLAFINTHILV